MKHSVVAATHSPLSPGLGPPARPPFVCEMQRFGRDHEYAGDDGEVAVSMLGTGCGPWGAIRAFVETHSALVVPGAAVPLGLELSQGSDLIRALQACSSAKDVHRIRVVLLPAECLGSDFLGVLGEVVSVRESHEMDAIVCTVHALCYARVPRAFATDRAPREAVVQPLRPVLPRPSTALPRRLALATGLRYAQIQRRARGVRVPCAHEPGSARTSPPGQSACACDEEGDRSRRFSAAACSRIGCGAATAQGCWGLTTSAADWTRPAARLRSVSDTFGVSVREISSRRRRSLSRRLKSAVPSIVRKGKHTRSLAAPSKAVAAAAAAAAAKSAAQAKALDARTDPAMPEDFTPVRGDEAYMLIAMMVTGGSVPWLPPSLPPHPGNAIRALNILLSDFLLRGDRERAARNVALARKVFTGTSGPVFIASNGATARLLVQPPSDRLTVLYNYASPTLSYVQDYYWVPLVDPGTARLHGWRFVDAGAVAAALIHNTPHFTPRPRLSLSPEQLRQAEGVMTTVMRGSVAGFWAFATCLATRARIPPHDLASFRRALEQWMRSQAGIAPNFNLPAIPACVAMQLTVAASEFLSSNRPACFDATSPEFHSKAQQQVDTCDFSSRLVALVTSNSGLAAALLHRGVPCPNTSAAVGLSTCLFMSSILPAHGPGVPSHASLWAELHEAAIAGSSGEANRLMGMFMQLLESGRHEQFSLDQFGTAIEAIRRLVVPLDDLLNESIG